MLQAMNTGVEGSMSTVHANSPRDAFSRLETMVMMADLEIPTRVILQQLASAIKIVVQVSRLQDGTRKIMNIAEVVAAHEDHVELQEIFIFDRSGVDEQGRVLGTFRATGIRPRIMERFNVSGIRVPESIFTESLAVNI
jgi:pilus assembly protein CpaF